MTERPSLVIELRTRTVMLELTCADHYAAIELYEELIAEARQGGKVQLVVDDLKARQGEE